MFYCILFSNKLKFIKKYSNLLINNFDNIKIIEIISTKSELSNIYKNNKNIDFIIFSNDDFSQKNIQAYLNNIRNKIIICKNLNCVKKTSSCIFIPENLTVCNTIKVLRNFISQPDENLVRQKVRNLLYTMKFDFKLKGTNYLLDSIVYSYINKKYYLYENLEKNIYPYVSKKYSVSIPVVKHSIIRAINSININYLKVYFNNFDRITSKTFISEIINHI